MAMRTLEDFMGCRVVIIKGIYKSKKGHVSVANVFGLYVDLDYKPLRVRVDPCEILVLDNEGKIDKISMIISLKN